VASGQRAAHRRGAIGERYILGGQNVLLSQMLRDVARIMNRSGPWLRLPWYAAFPGACVAEAIAFVNRREPLITLAGVRLARRRMFFTSAKAERELGFHARPYAEALYDAAQWFHEAGYLARGPQRPAAYLAGEGANLASRAPAAGE
ncbi:MAG: hypothetical protein J2P49_09710, partial [Methylocapsa sp.]|nr:hypothetical protein [Methylocapsa sp.]